MNTSLPDNEINKELKSRLLNMDIDSNIFKFFVSRVTSLKIDFYFLVTTQLNQPTNTKCGKGWINSTEIQVCVVLPKNTGSKHVLNEATEELRAELEDFSLPALSGMVVNNVEISIDNDLSEVIGGKVFYRKIVRLETTIN